MPAYTDADVRAASVALHAMWTSHPDECLDCKDDVVPVLDAVAPGIAARAWDEGFSRGFYDRLAGGPFDASESDAVNPYAADEIETGA